MKSVSAESYLGPAETLRCRPTQASQMGSYVADHAVLLITTTPLRMEEYTEYTGDDDVDDDDDDDYDGGGGDDGVD